MAAPDQAQSITVMNRRGVFIKWRWVKMLAIAFAALLLCIVLFFLLRETPSEHGTRLLVDAFSKQRVLEARLSGGFNGGVFNPSAGGKPDIDESELRRAETIIENAVDDSDPKTQLAYGRLLVLTGKATLAFKPLREAAAKMPERAEPHNDLGVLLLKQGKTEDAIEEFSLALKCDPDMPEALFNRALCYDKLMLRDMANEDCRRLLAIERNRTWFEETRERQQRVAAPITPKEKYYGIINAFDAAVASGDDAKAKTITEENLEAVLKYSSTYAATFLSALTSGDQENASLALFKIKRVGRALREKIGDTSMAEFGDYLGTLSIEEALVESQLNNEFLEAGTRQGSVAQPIYKRLGEQFAARKNYLLQFYCELNCSIHEYKTGLLAASLNRLKNTVAFVEKRNWPYRLAILFSQLAAVHSKLGQNSLAINFCDLALEEGREMQITEAKALQLKANAYSNVRDIDNSLLYLRKSTALYISSFPTFEDLVFNFRTMAECYSILGRHDLALLCAQQSIAFSDDKDLARQLAYTKSFVALERAQLKQFAEADQKMAEAFCHLEEVELKQRASVEPALLERRGTIELLRENFDRALQNYSRATDIIKNSEDKDLLINVLRARAEVHLQTKEYDQAKEDLKRASETLQIYRAKLKPQNRSSFLEASQGVFDEMILLNIRAFDNWSESFNISEQSRARTLLDAISAQPRATEHSQTPASVNADFSQSSAAQTVNPLSLAGIQGALPDDLRLLAYTVTSRGTFIFSVTSTGFEHAESPITTEKLDRLAQEFAALLKKPEKLDELREKARQLHHELIEPVEGQLGDGKQLVIIPDKALHYIPFAALVDREGKYLLDSYRITYAPSASVLVKCIKERKGKGATSDEKILAVGNPSFDQDKFPGLKRLADAETEAIEAAKQYSLNSPVLVNKNATKQRILKEMADCDVIHFSLHCLLEEKSSALVLAKAEGQRTEISALYSDSDDLLYLNEIYWISLPRAKLVILSACQSGLGQYYRGEGMVSLVRPFLARKVPTVIASLWSVDSQATASLMIDFHKERRMRKSQAGDALRAAQRRMSQGDSYRHPFYWAAFIAVGFDGTNGFQVRL